MCPSNSYRFGNHNKKNKSYVLNQSSLRVGGQKKKRTKQNLT